ncbi:hypothetical protein A4U53_009910 [Rhizobium ruizarguesonis]|uniref:Uncharacterized protein n=1 Tax=Rhizobium ruizarguesonis TaxID=2081791 RepID=A0ACD5EPR5_9HYPH
MTIDLYKLRQFYQASKDAHGALAGAWERYRDALTLRRRAREAFVRLVSVPSSLDPEVVLKPQKKEAFEKDRRLRDPQKAAAGKAVLDAERPFKMAEEEIARLQQKSNHAGRIWTRCRDYAQEQGVLPTDMEN